MGEVDKRPLDIGEEYDKACESLPYPTEPDVDHSSIEELYMYSTEVQIVMEKRVEIFKYIMQLKCEDIMEERKRVKNATV
jgi:hypothetical protein